MTGEALKNAFLSGVPVLYNNHQSINSQHNHTFRYSRIEAIIYRYINGKLVVSAELLDDNKHSVTIARAEDVEEAVS